MNLGLHNALSLCNTQIKFTDTFSSIVGLCYVFQNQTDIVKAQRFKYFCFKQFHK